MNVLAILFSVTTSFSSFGWWWCSRPCPIVNCESTVDLNLVAVLRSQLERCGPAELGARPCPACPTVPLGDLEPRRSFLQRSQEWLLTGVTFFAFGVASTFAFGRVVFGAIDSEIRVGCSSVPALTDANRYVPSTASNSRRV